MKKVFVLMLLVSLLLSTALSVSGASNGSNEGQNDLSPAQSGGEYGYNDDRDALSPMAGDDLCEGYTVLQNEEDPRCLYPVKTDGKYGYIDEQGAMVIAPRFDEAGRFSEGYAAVKQQDLYGFINKQGKLVIPCQYEEVKRFSEGKAAVKMNGKWGFINTEGSVIIDFQFAVCKPFSEGRAVIKYDTGYSGYIDETGEIAIPCNYCFAESFSEGLALVYGVRDDYPHIDYYPHFIDMNGNEAISSRRDYSSFSEGLALWDKASPKSNSRYSYVNKEGKVVIDGGYYSARSFSEGLACVADNYERYYFIDSTGKPAFGEKIFRYARSFSEGYAAVQLPINSFKIDGKEIPATPQIITYFTYIDHTGNYATDKIFDIAEDFSDGFAKVKVAGNRKWQLINRNFEVVWTFASYQDAMEAV